MAGYYWFCALRWDTGFAYYEKQRTFIVYLRTVVSIMDTMMMAGGEG